MALIDEQAKRVSRPGSVSITRFSGSSQGWHIVLEDETSRTRVVEIELTLEQFAQALGSHAECEFHSFNTGLVGMKYENKTEVVYIPAAIQRVSYGMRDAVRNDPLVQQALAPYEVDGWRADIRDLTNHHNMDTNIRGNALVQLAMKANLEDQIQGDGMDRGNAVRIVFRRWVNPETGQPVQR